MRISRFIFKWYQSFLTDRIHQTKVNNTPSDPRINQHRHPRALWELPSAFHIVHKWLCALFLDNYTPTYADDTILIC